LRLLSAHLPTHAPGLPSHLPTCHRHRPLPQETGAPELLRGLQALRRQLGEHTGQLKSLVKENFDRFISSKNTIDGIYAQLQRAEAEGEAGVHGASTQEVMESVQQVGGWVGGFRLAVGWGGGSSVGGR
jgi:hypothetical protein